MSASAPPREHLHTHPAIATPWGPSQSATRYDDGVMFHTTSSHGGFKLDSIRNHAMPTALRLADGWYEEDGEWARVATAFPQLFSKEEWDMADRILRDWLPDVWESLYGRRLTAAESFTRDRDHFKAANARNWVVISASRSTSHPGQVEALASIGGSRDRGERCIFLVACDDYVPGRHGFVIDPEKHCRQG